MKFRIGEQKTNIIKESKYLGLILDDHLTFEKYMETTKLKLNKANVLLPKIRHHVTSKLLKTMYSVFFESHLPYGCQLWG